jgi:hypothetical protein
MLAEASTRYGAQSGEPKTSSTSSRTDACRWDRERFVTEADGLDTVCG